MTSSVVTSVGAIDSLEFGSSTVYNFLTIAEVQGFSALGFSYSKITLDLSGAEVSFELDILQDKSMCFHFGSIDRIASGVGWDSLSFGDGSVIPQWLIVNVEGWDEFRSDLSLVRPSPYEISFNLIKPLASAMALNLSWGELTVSAGGIEFTQFGETLFETPFNARVEEGIDGLGIGISFVHYDEEIYFNFVELAPTGFNFYFGDQLTFSGTGWDSSQVGQGIIDSTWQHLEGSGFAATQFGMQRATKPDSFLVLNLHHAVSFNGENVVFYFGDSRAAVPLSFDLLAFGQHLVSKRDRRLNVYGSRFLAFGQPQVEWSGTPVLQAKGWDSLGRANPTIYNAAHVIQFFSQFGYATPPMTQWGVDAESDDPEDEGFKVYIRFPSIIDFNLEQEPDTPIKENPPWTQWGCEVNFNAGEYDEVECTFQVTYSTRWISLHDPHPGAYVGTAYIGYFNQTVWIPWAQYTEWGTLTVGRNTEFFAPSIYDGGVGQPSLTWGNVLWPVWDEPLPVAGGAEWISHSPRYITVQQREVSTEYMEGTTVWNLLQFVVQNGGEEYNHQWEMGDGHHIYNVNRVLGVMGLASLRMPVQFEGVFLTGRALSPPGLDATEYGDQLVAEAVRYYTPLSWDSLYVSRYTNTVHNAARNFTPEGFTSEDNWGQAKVWDNRQWVRAHQFLSEEVGLSFVAFRIREIVQWPSVWPLSTFGRPYTGLREQFVTFLPVDLYGVALGDHLGIGEFDVVGKPIPQIKPRWANEVDPFGYGRVWNFNPQTWPGRIHTYGASERTWVSHAPRYLEQPGRVPNVLGRPTVTFRDREFEAFGHNSLWVGTGLQVRNAAPDPPKDIVVRVEGICLDPKPSCPSCAEFGEILTQNNAIVIEGFDSLETSEAWVRVQGCIVRQHEPSLRFGVPYLGVPSYIVVEEFERIYEGPFWEEEREPQATQWGKPRISPHTIWCQRPTPVQAKKNHPESQEYCWPTHTVGTKCITPQNFGNSRVELENRTVFHYHSHPWLANTGWVGSPGIAFGTHRVYPESFKTSHVGLASFTPRTLKIYLMGFGREFKEDAEEDVAYGRPTVVNQYSPDPQAQTIVGGGVEFTQWGLFQLDPKTLWPEGFSATQWGNNEPMVHFPRVLYVQSFSATQWGDNWPSHKIRTVEMMGVVPPNWWMYDFDERMQVIGGNQFNPDIDLIYMEGLNATEWGDWVIPTTIEVAPYMIAPPCIPYHSFEIAHA